MNATTTQLLSSGEFCKLRYDTTPVKSASANISFYTNNSKMPNYELWHSCRKWAISNRIYYTRWKSRKTVNADFGIWKGVLDAVNVVRYYLSKGTEEKQERCQKIYIVIQNITLTCNISTMTGVLTAWCCQSEHSALQSLDVPRCVIFRWRHSAITQTFNDLINEISDVISNVQREL